MAENDKYKREIQAKRWTYEQVDFRSPKKGEFYAEADMYGNIQILKADADWLVSYQRPIVKLV